MVNEEMNWMEVVIIGNVNQELDKRRHVLIAFWLLQWIPPYIYLQTKTYIILDRHIYI